MAVFSGSLYSAPMTLTSDVAIAKIAVDRTCVNNLATNSVKLILVGEHRKPFHTAY